MRFNLKTGLASQKRLSASAVDFPRVNESYTGRCNALISAFKSYISFIKLLFDLNAWIMLSIQEATICLWNHVG